MFDLYKAARANCTSGDGSGIGEDGHGEDGGDDGGELHVD